MIVKSSREKLVDAICDYYNRQANGLDRNITIEQFYPMWIEQKTQYAAPTTINRDKKNWKKFYEGDAIVRKPIRELTKIEEDTKGKYGDRKVPLTPEAKHLLQCALQKKTESGIPAEEFIFLMDGSPKDLYKAIGRAFETYCKGITELKSSHKARKTYISRLIANGVNINSIRSYVGHKDERTTYNSYCFDIRPEDEKLAQVVSALSV